MVFKYDMSFGEQDILQKVLANHLQYVAMSNLKFLQCQNSKRTSLKISKNNNPIEKWMELNECYYITEIKENIGFGCSHLVNFVKWL